MQVREIFKEKLLSLLNEGILFKRETIDILNGYAVYIFLKRNNKRPIYIGMSKDGIRRVLSTQRRKEILEQYDQVLIYRANDLRAAKEAEKILIAALNPKYNLRGAINREAEMRRAFQGDHKLIQGLSNGKEAKVHFSF